MKEISLCHAEFIIFPFCEQEAEHYGYDEEFFSSDLMNPVQAEYAINKWLIPEVGSWTEIRLELRREAARVCISQGTAFGDTWLPGISDRLRLTAIYKSFNQSHSIPVGSF